jgi:hypothetical protein
MTETTTGIGTRVIQSEASMNYKPFRHTIRKYINGKITREGFVSEWRIEQKEQRIRSVRRRGLLT